MKSYYLNSKSKSTKVIEGARLVIGRRGHGADIEIDDTMVSRKHAEIHFMDNIVKLRDVNSLHGIKVNGTKIQPEEWHVLSEGDQIIIISETFKLSNVQHAERGINDEKKIEAEKFTSNDHSPHSSFKEMIQIRGKVKVGRSTLNDIVLLDEDGKDSSLISREHAVFSYEKGSFWVQDLNSTNGTYLNDLPLKSKTQIKESDNIQIEFFHFNLLEGYKDIRKEKYAISAVNIERVYPNGLGLQPISIDIPNQSFIALMGPSGCGKSTLLKCLNGVALPFQGEVYIHGLELTSNFNFLKKKIGYVPQDDIIHRELTVYKSLYYAAKLRLPDDTTEEKIQSKISEVVKNLNLGSVMNSYIHKISGGQRKRVSIAVELLTDPTILFLDEPTSPLDPETIDSFLKTLQQLAKNGTTIIMVTHKPEDLNYVKKVIFLKSQGYLTYYDKPERILARFGKQKITEVYALMASDNRDVVQKYYIRPLSRYRKKPFLEVKHEKKDAALIQLFWLITRYFNLKLNDKSNLVLLLAQPLIIAGLISVIFDEFRIGVLFLMAISGIWFGVSNAAKEIVGEMPIYQRERMFNININAYILSKWVVLSTIALIQTIIFVSIIHFKFKIFYLDGFPDIYLRSFTDSFLYMFYISASSTLIGLLLSAFFDNTEKVMTVVPIALMPQIMLAGVITKIDNVLVELVSFFMIGRWGTEGFARIQDLNFTNQGVSQDSLESVITYIPEIKVDTLTSEMGTSVNTVLNPDKLIPIGNSALKVLDFYNQELVDSGALIGKIFDSINANILVIGLLDIMLYVLIYVALKQKDSIKNSLWN